MYTYIVLAYTPNARKTLGLPYFAQNTRENNRQENSSGTPPPPPKVCHRQFENLKGSSIAGFLIDLFQFHHIIRRRMARDDLLRKAFDHIDHTTLK